MCATSLLAPALILPASMLPSDSSKRRCLLQIIFSTSVRNPLDLKSLDQLTHLELTSEVNSHIAVSFPTQLRRVTIRDLKLTLHSWTSLSGCSRLQHLDCQLVLAPLISPEAFPQLQSLMLDVDSYDLSRTSGDEVIDSNAVVSWAAGLASRSVHAVLHIHDDADALMQPRFQGLHLDRLHLRGECTEKFWQHLNIRHLVANDFLGQRLTREVLPASLVTGCIWALDATSMLVDLTGCCNLQEFHLSVLVDCELTLHGSFQHKRGCVEWLGNMR